MYFVYAKIQPFVEEFRQKSGMPEFLVNVQKVVEGSPKAGSGWRAMQKRAGGDGCGKPRR